MKCRFRSPVKAHRLITCCFALLKALFISVNISVHKRREHGAIIHFFYESRSSGNHCAILARPLFVYFGLSSKVKQFVRMNFLSVCVGYLPFSTSYPTVYSGQALCDNRLAAFTHQTELNVLSHPSRYNIAVA